MTGTRSASVLAWLHLMRVYDKMQHRAMEHLKDYEVTPAQFDVIAHLYAAPGITQQALAERLIVTKGNVCGLIGRMQDHGLVERHTDPEDARSWLLHLTDKGNQLAQRVIPDQEAFIQEQLSTMCSEEQGMLLKLLRDLDHSLS